MNFQNPRVNTNQRRFTMKKCLKRLFSLFPLPVMFFSLAFSLSAGFAHAWGVSEKDIKEIRNDVAILYEKLDSFEKKAKEDNEVLIRNQAASKSDIAAILDDTQHAMAKLDELTQILGMQLDKNARAITTVQSKLESYAIESSTILKQLRERTELNVAEIKESNDGKVATMDEKINSLMELLKAYLDTEAANKEAVKAEFKGTSKKIADLVGISKKAVKELSKKPEKQAAKVNTELAKMNKKIIGLTGVLKSSIVENSKNMEKYNQSIQKLINTFNKQLESGSSPQKKKP